LIPRLFTAETNDYALSSKRFTCEGRRRARNPGEQAEAARRQSEPISPTDERPAFPQTQ
jgi:hypothetical protein